MTLQQELGLINPIESSAHEVLMNVVFTGELLAKEMNRLLRPFQLTDAQFNVLLLLRYQSNRGGMTQTDLGKMLLVNRSNVTGLVDRMEKAGWVSRSADAGDRRVNQIKITKPGKRLLERVETIYYTRIEEIMTSFASEEHTQLCHMLERVRGAMRNTDSPA